MASQKGLNPRQQRFVEEYLKDPNATQAAIRAGYSEKTAQEQSSRLLSQVMVQEAVTVARRGRSERTEIDADWVLTRLAGEATADLADLYREDGELKPVREWPLVWRQGLISGLDVDETRVDGRKLGQVTKVKLSDRIKRIELIGKHVDVQAFAERHEHTGKDGGSLKVEDVTVIEAARRIAYTLAKGSKATDKE